jgi:hypothetical protein
VGCPVKLLVDGRRVAAPLRRLGVVGEVCLRQSCSVVVTFDARVPPAGGRRRGMWQQMGSRPRASNNANRLTPLLGQTMSS